MRLSSSFSILLASSIALLTPILTTTQAASAADMAVVQQSRPYVARAGAWQTWSDHLHIKAGMEKRNLVLNFNNAAEGRPAMTDIQVELNRKPFITFKDFAGKNDLTKNITGTLPKGDALVTVKGFGPSGARLSWQLVTDKVTVAEVKPNPFGYGESLEINGANFSDNASDVKVTVGGKPATVKSSTATKIVAKAPQISGGPKDIVVSVGGTQNEPFKAFSLGQPHISWVDLIAAPPSHPVVISGTGFGPTPAENHVTFGKHPATVVSATDKSITVNIPMMDFPVWHVPITVTVHGVASKEKKVINVDHRIIENRGIHQY